MMHVLVYGTPKHMQHDALIPVGVVLLRLNFKLEHQVTMLSFVHCNGTLLEGWIHVV
jgi:hypothetical protein